ncbi:MAG: DUF1848 domain-containing protein [Parabacteroides sp.]|nr:DUF1848 domain-containing protein [Parabacteroides sp.]
MSTGKLIISTDSGEQVEALAPVIISASRSTDIPAFYAKWFFNRLAKGYCVWYNPFNRQKMYVSFERCKAIVFWTKNPKPILPYLHELDERGIHYYFQFTLNDYVNEGFEPNVPSVERRVDTFRKLSRMIGKERVIWRFDPLIITSSITPRVLLSRIWKIGNLLKGYTDKLVFSFVDVKAYRKVQNNLIKETDCFTKDDVETAEMNAIQRQEIIEGLVKLRDVWASDGWNVTLATCAEDIDLAVYGIEHNRCIDEELMERAFGNDYELVYYLWTGQLPEPDLFGTLPDLPDKKKNLKDKGQRKACGCMISKDIGMYNTCRHFCVYCYANTSKDCVLKNMTSHFFDSESIIG